MDAAVRKIKLKAEQTSINGTILTLATTIGSLAVGLAWITNAQEGVLIATTTPAIVVAGVIANILHTGQIEPSAASTAILAFFGQLAADVVAFVPSWSSTIQLVIPVVAAVVLCFLQLAHAFLSRKVIVPAPKPAPAATS
ncbi:MAG: hypothetical protein KGL39_38175 [Patescibacteria group bacterium]|nr:hypothetical protein [Patescibacteria group bacterium]